MSTQQPDPTPGSTPSQSGTLRVRTVARPGVLVLALLVTGCLIAAAFVAGRSIQPATATAANAQAAPVVATAKVEMRVVQQGVSIPAKIVLPEIVNLTLSTDGVLGVFTKNPTATGGDTGAAPTTPEGAAAGAAASGAAGTATTKKVPEPVNDRNVITRMFAAPGEQLAPGALLAEVSGRPIIAVAADTPIYRDIVPGISGEDVKSLEQLLVDLGYDVYVDGFLDVGMMNTLAYWYRQLGYELPVNENGTRWLPWRELLPLPAGTLRVAGVSPPGTALGPETPLLTVHRGDPVIQVAADAAQVTDFRQEHAMYVRTADAVYEANVLSISELQLNNDTLVSSHTVTLSCPPELIGSEQATITVLTAKPGEPGPAIPVIAVREDGKGKYVSVATDPPNTTTPAAESNATQPAEPSTPAQRIDIDVLAIAGGWVAIQENPALPEGTRIRVE